MQTRLLSFFMTILLVTFSSISFAQETKPASEPVASDSASTDSEIPATIPGEVKKLPEEFQFVQDDIKLVEFLMVLKQQVTNLQQRNQELAKANETLSARLDAQEKLSANQAAALTKQSQDSTQAIEAVSAGLAAHKKQAATDIAGLRKQHTDQDNTNKTFTKRLDDVSKQSETRITELEKRNAELLAEIEKLEAANKKSATDLASVTTQLGTLTQEVVNVQETMADHTSILSGSEESKEVGLLERMTKTEDRLSTHGKELTEASNDIMSLSSNIEQVTKLTKEVQAGVSDVKSRLNAISYPAFDGHGSDDGTLALRGNMARETFQEEFHQANQFRVQFFNFTGQEQFIIVNGAHWRVQTGTSYVNVPRGKVRLGYRGEWSTLDDWVVDDDGYFINFTLPIPYENQ